MPGALKLFVWEGVRRDWAGGIAFALAETEAEARQLIVDKDPQVPWHTDNAWVARPKVYCQPFGMSLEGGS